MMMYSFLPVGAFLMLVNRTMQTGFSGHSTQMESMHDLNISMCTTVRPTRRACQANGTLTTLSSEDGGPLYSGLVPLAA